MQAARENKIRYKGRKNIIEYCKELERHCTGEKQHDSNLIVNGGIFSKPIRTVWMNHLRQIWTEEEKEC